MRDTLKLRDSRALIISYRHFLIISAARDGLSSSSDVRVTANVMSSGDARPTNIGTYFTNRISIDRIWCCCKTMFPVLISAGFAFLFLVLPCNDATSFPHMAFAT